MSSLSKRTMLIAGLLSGIPASVLAGGINCKKASTPMDRVICGSEALLKLDASMADLFQEKLQQQIQEKRKGLIDGQKAWLSARDACLSQFTAENDSNKRLECVVKAYQTRVVDLEKLPADSRYTHCYETEAEEGPYQLATLRNQEDKVAIQSKMEENTSEKFRLMDFLKPNDTVVVSRRYRNWGCSALLRKEKDKWTDRHELTGWLPLDKLNLRKVDANPKLSDWKGKWVNSSENFLKLNPSANGTGISVEGYASYHVWIGDEETLNEGEVSGTAKPQGNNLVVHDGGCKVTITHLGTYLLAIDNEACGGMNVRFNDLYIRAE